MKLVADESVDQPIVNRLREDGHDIVAVVELEPGISDEDVLAIAVRQDAVLITSDTDFGDLIFRQALSSAGIVLLRLAGLSSTSKADAVSRAVTGYGHEFSMSFSVIGPSTVRVRRGGV